ncbi:MAG: hypothetical protein AB7V34_00445 [Brachymonas sp.]
MAKGLGQQRESVRLRILGIEGGDMVRDLPYGAQPLCDPELLAPEFHDRIPQE